jgi:hypothetical protein
MNAVVNAAHEPGIRFDEPVEDYHRKRLGVASKSGLDQVAKSPAHYRAWALGAEQPTTPAMKFGSAFHMAVLEPAKFCERYVTAPDFRVHGHPSSNAYKHAKAQWLADNAGLEMIDQDDMERINRMAEALRAHPLARNLLAGGTPEASLKWTDPDTGLACKGRVDYWLPEIGVAVDLKTTESAKPSTFARSVAAYRYHVQDVFYSRGFSEIGQAIRHFLFVAVEKEAPHLVSVCYCDDAARERGEQLVQRDMATLAECVRTDTWPGYGDELQPLQLPAYAFYD